MTRIGMRAGASLALVGFLVAIAGCQRDEGPLEKAGKEIDQSVAKAGQQIEKAGDKLQDAAQGNPK